MAAQIEQLHQRLGVLEAAAEKQRRAEEDRERSRKEELRAAHATMMDPRAEPKDRLRALKGRGAEKAISVLVTEAMIEAVVAEVPPRARALMAAHWPGPLTLALPARPGLPEGLVMDGCVAVRWPASPPMP